MLSSSRSSLSERAGRETASSSFIAVLKFMTVLVRVLCSRVATGLDDPVSKLGGIAQNGNHLAEIPIGKEGNVLLRTVPGKQPFGEKQFRLCADAEIRSAVAHVDALGMPPEQSAFANPGSRGALLIAVRKKQPPGPSAAATIQDKPVGNDRKMVKTALSQDALDEIVDAIADDGDRDAVGDAKIDEGGKERVDDDLVERFVELLEGRPDQGNLALHTFP